MKRVPPRLYAILAREADYGVVFRRGPSRQVAVIGWNTNDDSFELGQWLKGRIYERRSDLSPDGRHLIYFAMDGRWHKGDGSWTAISRAPYLTALMYYGWGNCWGGGGVFDGNTRFWLDGHPLDGAQKFTDCGLHRQDDLPSDLGDEYYLEWKKLIRDGWYAAEHRKEIGRPHRVFTKQVRFGWHIEKYCFSEGEDGPNNAVYWERHRLIGPDTEIDGADWEWADVDGRDVVYAARGALWRMRVGENSADIPRLLKDLTDMQFEARTAPYQGVPAGERGQ